MAVELRSHKVNGLNDTLEVRATDDPGSGGAHHVYQVAWEQTNRAAGVDTIRFQSGPIKEAGVNGGSIEALLAICEHRLTCFQCGPFASRENAVALTKIQEAMHWLHHRTRERMFRGVEGTMAK